GREGPGSPDCQMACGRQPNRPESAPDGVVDPGRLLVFSFAAETVIVSKPATMRADCGLEILEAHTLPGRNEYHGPAKIAFPREPQREVELGTGALGWLTEISFGHGNDVRQFGNARL